MTDSFLPRNKQLVQLSRNLRSNATKEERHLWYDFLRSYPVQFNRQRIIGNYIADFYCERAKLIVELDGSQHYEADAAQRDTRRTEYFESLGIEVIRFANTDVTGNFDGVCYTVDNYVKSRLK